MNWQPIETIPVDTWVLIHNKEWERPFMAYKSSSIGCWLGSEGIPSDPKPTHWVLTPKFD